MFRKANRSRAINLWWQSAPHFFGFINCKWVMFPQQLETLQANLWPIFCLMVGFGGWLFGSTKWRMFFGRSLKYSASGIGIPVSFRILSRESCVFRGDFNPKGSEVIFRLFLLKCVRRYRLNWYGIRTLMEEKMAIQFSSISCSNVFEVSKSWVIYDPWLFAELPHLETTGE